MSTDNLWRTLKRAIWVNKLISVCPIEINKFNLRPSKLSLFRKLVNISQFYTHIVFTLIGISTIGYIVLVNDFEHPNFVNFCCIIVVTIIIGIMYADPNYILTFHPEIVCRAVNQIHSIKIKVKGNFLN